MKSEIKEVLSVITTFIVLFASLIFMAYYIRQEAIKEDSCVKYEVVEDFEWVYPDGQTSPHYIRGKCLNYR